MGYERKGDQDFLLAEFKNRIPTKIGNSAGEWNSGRKIGAVFGACLRYLLPIFCHV